jgi:hypothetical protein
MADTDARTEARRLLDNATPGPWTRPSPTANWFTVPQPIQIDEADWGQETQDGGALCGYRIGTLADDRAWRYTDVELIAAAPRLIAELLAELDAADQWKREATEVIESWERVYEALGDVGGLGQRRSDAVLAEVLRLLAERDAAVARADTAEADRDRHAAQLAALHDAIGDPDELRAHELDMSDGTVNTSEVTHEIVRDILLRIADAAAARQEPT